MQYFLRACAALLPQSLRATGYGSIRSNTKTGEYGTLKEPKNVGEGKNFTQAQKKRIPLNSPQQSVRGKKGRYESG